MGESPVTLCKSALGGGGGDTDLLEGCGGVCRRGKRVW